MIHEDWRPVVRAFKEYPQYWTQTEFKCVFTPLGYSVWTANGFWFVAPHSHTDSDIYRYGAWGKIRVYIAWQLWRRNKKRDLEQMMAGKRKEAIELHEFLTKDPT